MTSRTARSDSTAPTGLPGKFKISEVSRTPQMPRANAAKGVFFEPSLRIFSAIPGIVRSQMVSVASGVISRSAMPVPPVVTMRRACLASLIKAAWIWVESSGTSSRPVTWKPEVARSSATAGPEASWRSPRAQESLTVITAAEKIVGGLTLVVEEDVFFLFRIPTG